jgi:hypothetical protein
MKGVELFEKANHFKLEGIVAKKKDSDILPGCQNKAMGEGQG